MESSLDILNFPLPTLDRLGATIPPDLDAKKIARTWFNAFSAFIVSNDVQGVSTLLIKHALWRDILSLTWDFRIFSGITKITQFMNDRLASVHPRAFKLREDPYLRFQKPAPDLAWIMFFFDFESDAGIASGVVRLVPTATGEWKGYTVFTNLEGLRGFPEKVGALRNSAPNHGKWEEERRREFEFEDHEPTVLIVGAGQCGLGLAARLKVLGVSTLVVEKNARIGDNWRDRYKALCLYSPVCK